MSRTTRLVACALSLALAMTAATGCAKDEPEDMTDNGTVITAEPVAIKIGTLPTEDALPLWVAEAQGMFAEAGLEVEITTFQAAQERDVALASGAIDAYMGDIMASAALEAGGSPVSLVTVMLGTTPAEGRFGIVAAPGSDATSLTDLAGVPIGTSSASIQEYVVDGLMAGAAVPADDVKKEIVPKVPVRFELLMNGQIEAAALPEPLLSLAELQGAKLLADDTTGVNLTQTVLGVSDKYLATPGGMVTVSRLLDVWDQAVDVINADPTAWRTTLVDKANLPEVLKDSYAVNTYPKATVPTSQQVESILAWMRANELLTTALTYDDLVQEMPQ
ncbi:MAG: ABC transporter substrate-binding protein [Coriobacteriia bacterium]|nr:ABC transporter substrate-binding protein [Coriobacteriia bacterium]MBN2822232.1 ABC transporter substrate-binding protein [Coriobacteriia bacterium]